MFISLRQIPLFALPDQSVFGASLCRRTHFSMENFEQNSIQVVTSMLDKFSRDSALQHLGWRPNSVESKSINSLNYRLDTEGKDEKSESLDSRKFDRQRLLGVRPSTHERESMKQSNIFNTTRSHHSGKPIKSCPTQKLLFL